MQVYVRGLISNPEAWRDCSDKVGFFLVSWGERDIISVGFAHRNPRLYLQASPHRLRFGSGEFSRCSRRIIGIGCKCWMVPGDPNQQQKIYYVQPKAICYIRWLRSSLTITPKACAPIVCHRCRNRTRNSYFLAESYPYSAASLRSRNVQDASVPHAGLHG